MLPAGRSVVKANGVAHLVAHSGATRPAFRVHSEHHSGMKVNAVSASKPNSFGNPRKVFGLHGVFSTGGCVGHHNRRNDLHREDQFVGHPQSLSSQCSSRRNAWRFQAQEPCRQGRTLNFICRQQCSLVSHASRYRHILLVLLQMSRIVSYVVFFLLFTGGIAILAAETLEDTLRTAKVPTQQFPASELGRKITSYAISDDDPFLLAYYVDDGSGLLQPPLRVIRYDRATGNLQRGDIGNASALFQGEIAMNCLGSALEIRECRDIIYVDTHYNPSAGCVIVLSSRLEFKAALSGWLLGFVGADGAILRRSEVHFMSVHPMHIAVFDVGRNQSTEIYPYKDDPQRRQYSRLIAPHISEEWCVENNAQCDPENFDTDLRGNVIVNENAKVFAFQAQFDAAGFGPRAEKQVPPLSVAYIFRERGGRWQHREFQQQQLQRLLGGISLDELIAQKPDLFFQIPAGK